MDNKNDINSLANIKEPVFHFMDDFKNFVLKKNALDMALGITIGIAFGKVISSLVNDIIMPPIGIIIGGVNLPDLKIILKHSSANNMGKIIDPEVAIYYGKFIQIAIDFLIVAFSAFLVIKILNKLTHKAKKDIDWTKFINK